MIRKSFTDLSADERDALGHALNGVFDSNLVNSNATLHDDNFYNGIHWGPAFLPWHRDFLRKFEVAMQAFEPSVNLPYWDWTDADSRSLEVEPWLSFFGGRSNSGGLFDHWDYVRNNTPNGTLPTYADIVTELEATTFLEFRALETGSHRPGHVWTGGSMASGKSPLDPLFYLHHCNLDRLWSIWQLNNPEAVQYEHTGVLSSDGVPQARVPLNSPMIDGATPASILDHTTLGFLYQRDQALENEWFAKHGTDLITHVEPSLT